MCFSYKWSSLTVVNIIFFKHPDAGKSFGEIALISKDSVRNATIIADEDTDTMAIDKDTYGDTLKVSCVMIYSLFIIVSRTVNC